MLDFIYDGVEPDYQMPAGITPLGESVFRWLIWTPATAGVRARRAYIAQEIDRSPAAIASAFGRRRTCSRNQSVLEMSVPGAVQLTAPDQDELALAAIRERYSDKPRHAIAASVFDLLENRISPGTCDMVYWLGLYDYLPDATAKRRRW